MLNNKLFLAVFILVVSGNICFAADPKASQIRASTANFNNNLSSSDDSVQEALDTIDNLPISSSGDSISVNGTGVNDVNGVNFLDGDIDWTFSSGASPDTLTASVVCSGCIQSGDIQDDNVGFVDVVHTLDVATNPSLSASQCFWGASGIVCEAGTANSVEMHLEISEVVGTDKIITFPDETGTVCTTGSICNGYQAGPLSGDVVTSSGTATIQADSVALSTDTTGNYVQSITTSSPLTGGDGGSEGAGLTLSVISNSITGEHIDETQDYSFQTLSGKIDRNNTAIDDDNCTGEQGVYWYDTTDSAFEFCNASSGPPTTIGGGSGDVTDVGPGCSSGACYSDGTVTTGPTILVWEGTSSDSNEFRIGGPSNPSVDQTVLFPDDQIVDDDVMLANGSGTVQYVNIPNCTDSSGNHLNYTSSSNSFSCGTSSSVTDTNADRRICWSASDTLPLEASESIATLSKKTGTNIDIIVAQFDDSTDECRSVQISVPSDIQTGATITFRTYWFAETAAANNVIWDFRHTGTGTEGESWDQSLTTETAAADAASSTTNQMTVTSWTETLTNLGWAATDVITGVLCRDANNGSDTLTGDANLIMFCMDIPRQ
jgi:hypothetical protein